VTNNYIRLRFGSNSEGNHFSENIFTRNLPPVETGASDVSGSAWAVNGVGDLWDDDVDLDLDRDGINDLPHRELDLLGVLRRDFPAIAFLLDSPTLKLLRFANERAAIPGVSAIEDPAPLTSRFLNPEPNAWPAQVWRRTVCSSTSPMAPKLCRNESPILVFSTELTQHLQLVAHLTLAHDLFKRLSGIHWSSGDSKQTN
jgi:hypothetical protein